MIRRFLRIFFVVGLVVLIVAAAVQLFWEFGLHTRYGFFWAGPQGVMVGTSTTSSMAWWYERIPPARFSIWNFLSLPQMLKGPGGTGLLFPWWLLILMWGISTALVRRLTRHRKEGHGFPITETTAKAK